MAWGIASDQRLDTSKLLCAKPSGQTGQLSGLVASEKPIAKIQKLENNSLKEMKRPGDMN